jgi:hypothetical protein
VTALDLRVHRPRSRDLRVRVRHAADSTVGALVAGGRAVAPAPLRRHLARHLLWDTSLRSVPVDSLLLGGQNGTTAGQVAAAHRDLLWGSRRVADGPHVELLRAAQAGPLSDGAVLASAYAEMARAAIRTTGQYFGARDDAGILAVARDFLEDRTSSRPHASPVGQPVLVAPVRGSRCFQVVDGHHRLARLVVAGGSEALVRCRRLPVTTPLQEVLEQMSWIGGERELYQPLAAPELVDSWRTVRHCEDRATRVLAAMERYGIPAGRSSYLDVASCYGWFLARMRDAGLQVSGVERDPLAPVLGAAAYALPPGTVTTGDAVDFLAAAPERAWDVVSCFSLLHHFVLGRGPVGPEELVRLLSRATGRVLFLDTGEEHEDWFRTSLRGWDATAIAGFLAEHGDFDLVEDLGADRDGTGPYAGNYGRHLFACVRSR